MQLILFGNMWNNPVLLKDFCLTFGFQNMLVFRRGLLKQFPVAIVHVDKKIIVCANLWQKADIEKLSGT